MKLPGKYERINADTATERSCVLCNSILRGAMPRYPANPHDSLPVNLHLIDATAWADA
jgi:hypothetical protein